MRIIIDVSHPAHVHYFRNLAKNLIGQGHKVLFTAREKECVVDLLKYYELHYRIVGRNQKGVIKKIINIPLVNYRVYRIAKQFKPDLFIGFGSFSVAQVAFLLKKKSLIFDDTEHSTFQNLLYRPFATNIITPSCFKKNYGKKHTRFNGFMELAYLHPNYFNPNPSVLEELGIKKDEKYFVVRFVSWDASHDKGHRGLTLDSKRAIIKLLSKYGKVFISSEKPLSKEFERYKLHISPEKIHYVLYYATMYIGEGATMATEAAILGTPSIYISSLAGTMGNFIELQEKYGLCYSFKDPYKAFNKIKLLLQSKNLKKEWQINSNKMLCDKIDVTKFMTELIIKD